MSAWFWSAGFVEARWLRAIFPRNLVARPNMVNAVAITSGCRSPNGADSPQKYGDSGAGFRAKYQGPGDDVGCLRDGLIAALRAQRCSALHGDGRDGGGGAHRGGGRPRHPHGGRAAGGAGADERALRPRVRRSAPDGCNTPRRSAFRRCARASRGTIARPTASTIDPARVVVTTGSSAGFILAFLALFEPGDRVAVALPGYPPYRHILSALGCEPVAIETTQATRWAITPDMLIAAHRRAPLKGVLVASPANPTGTMMTARGAARSHRGRGRRGDQVHLRRDLSRPRLRVRGRDRRAALRQCGDHQLVLEIFLHDRLAHRLDGGAGAARAHRRAPAGQSRDLGADALADRGRGGLRRTRRDGGGEARLRGEPAHSARRPAARRASTRSFPSTAPSISMPTCRASATTASTSPSACSRRRTWRRRRASISIRCRASTSSASAMRARAAEMHEAVERIGTWLKR